VSACLSAYPLGYSPRDTCYPQYSIRTSDLGSRSHVPVGCCELFCPSLFRQAREVWGPDMRIFSTKICPRIAILGQEFTATRVGHRRYHNATDSLPRGIYNYSHVLVSLLLQLSMCLSQNPFPPVAIRRRHLALAHPMLNARWPSCHTS
jgi:hypothetical protein